MKYIMPIILALLISLTGCFQEKTMDEITSCEKDTDCMIVESRCCNNKLSINKDYEDYWNSYIKKESKICELVDCAPRPVLESRGVCRSNVCTRIAKEPGTAEINISLSEPFVLYKDQIARIPGMDFKLFITEFHNSPCPEGSQCVWEGVGIQFQGNYKNQVVQKLITKSAIRNIGLLELSPSLYVLIWDTDFETYAYMNLQNIEEES